MLSIEQIEKALDMVAYPTCEEQRIYAAKALQLAYRELMDKIEELQSDIEHMSDRLRSL